MRHLGVVPARSGSKRLPGKNIAMLDGLPLIAHTARACRGACSLAAVVVSTDSPEISRVAQEHGLLDPGLRPPELAADTSPAIDAMRDALCRYETVHGRVDTVVLLQPTSPFRTARLIDEACRMYEATGADTLTAVRPVSDHPWWCWREVAGALVPHGSAEAIATDRADLPEVLIETGTIYIVSRALVLDRRFYGERVVGYRVDERAAVDIDTAMDMAWAEFLVSRDRAALASS